MNIYTLAQILWYEDKSPKIKVQPHLMNIVK